MEFSRDIRLELTATTPRSIVKQALLAIKVPENVRVRDLTEDNLRVMVDGDKMQRVLINLIQNALEAMPHGGDLTISSRQLDGELAIEVADTGIGILSDDLDKIWTPLYTTKAKGIGLGLAICKRIVEEHGGSISLNSVTGKGSLFTVAIPIKPSAEVKQNE